MYSNNPKIYKGKENRLSFACLFLCMMMFLILGVLPKIPSPVTRILRPLFITLSVLSFPKCRYYPLGSLKYHIVNLLYYTVIFLWFPFSSISIEAYISAMMFILFLVFAASRKWTRKEIELIIIVIVIACDVQALLTLISNSNLLHSNGSSHLSFLGTQVNRNPVAFAIVPGTLCGAFAFLYSNGTKGNVNKAFFLLSIVLCFFVVFAIGCRSAFFSSAVGIACIAWQKARDGATPKEKVRRKAFVILLLIIATIGAMYAAKGTYSSRLFEFGAEANSSGRDQLYEEAWRLIDEKPIFGGGFDYWESNGNTMGTHNTFLTFMVSTGWVGGILLGLFLLAVLNEIIKTRNLVPISFMIEVFLHSWTEPGMDYYAYIPLLLSIVLTRYLRYENSNIGSIFR